MGTQNIEASKTLKEIAVTLIGHFENKDFGETNDFVSTTILEHAVGTVLLSWALIKAGSGDLELLRLCRKISLRLPKKVNYGLHLALSDAIGILFLGGCR